MKHRIGLELNRAVKLVQWKRPPGSGPPCVHFLCWHAEDVSSWRPPSVMCHSDISQTCIDGPVSVSQWRHKTIPWCAKHHRVAGGKTGRKSHIWASGGKALRRQCSGVINAFFCHPKEVFFWGMALKAPTSYFRGGWKLGMFPLKKKGHYTIHRVGPKPKIAIKIGTKNALSRELSFLV